MAIARPERAVWSTDKQPVERRFSPAKIEQKARRLMASSKHLLWLLVSISLLLGRTSVWEDLCKKALRVVTLVLWLRPKALQISMVFCTLTPCIFEEREVKLIAPRK